MRINKYGDEVYLMVTDAIKFFYGYLAVFKNCLEGFAFKNFFRMMWDSSLSATRIPSPDLVTSFSLPIEGKAEPSYYVGYFSICNSRKMFSQDMCLYCNRYWYLETEMPFTFSDNRRQKFSMVFSALNMEPSHILDIINNLCIRFAFSMASLKCQTFCKISSLFTRFNYYREKIYFFHNIVLLSLSSLSIYSVIYNTKKLKAICDMEA